MIDYKNKISLKEQEYFMFIPISHERIDLLINTTYYDIGYDNLGQEILFVKHKTKDEPPIVNIGQEVSVIIDDKQCFCIQIERLSLESVDKNMVFINIMAKKKNVSYLFLLPLCEIADKVKKYPISNVYTVLDNPLQIILKMYKPFIKDTEKLEIIKDEYNYIYVKMNLNLYYIHDIDLIYEGRYSMLYDETKDIIYNYHVPKHIPRGEHLLYHVFNRTEKRRKELSKELGVEIHPLQELYSKITKKENYDRTTSIDE